ncbi:taf13p [Saccharomyces arboricola H-6]|uniref:Transcription initiation factor TFIID subunit 13 n=1 Tax=Saccharomyces arboricola (strain H-6 / AS 2.3317 / CBS 10644) TaxID=1160507 RepID=J8PYP8_SACAR|nr:taf13p [Saccharomyces arboricola H-6]
MSRKLKKTNLFNKDVSSLLYAYGDVPQPLQATVQCLDELVSGYLVDICTNAFHTAQNSQRNKLRLEDLKFALRNDPVKLGRAEELIATNKLITEAKKQFNETDNQNSLKRYRAGDEEGDEMEEDEDEQPITDEDDETNGRNNGKQFTEARATKTKKQGTRNPKKTKK